ncbi:MAG: hypothetical protein RQ833_05820 [Sphingomonadaceae bacterium]|nr:hypothetical protein [Sphingomonadaceae bacterium]
MRARLATIALLVSAPAFGATVRVADPADLVQNDGLQFRTTDRVINGVVNPGIPLNQVQTFQTGSPTSCGIAQGPRLAGLFRVDGTFDATDPLYEGRLLTGSAAGDYVAPGDTFAGSLPATGPADSSCFLSLSRRGSSVTSAQIVPLSPNLRYLGWYWGSIDPYNFVNTITQNGTGIQFTTGGGASIGNTQGFTGQQLTTALGLQPFGSYFIEFRFTAAEAANLDGGAIQLQNLRIPAFELDNITGSTSTTVGSQSFGELGATLANLIDEPERDLVAAPTPAAAALFGLGLLGLAARRRRAR